MTDMWLWSCKVESLLSDSDRESE